MLASTVPATALAASDTSAPTLVSLSADRTTVDVGASAQTITFTARIQDDLSGFYYGGVQFSRPSGGSSVSGSWKRTSGTVSDGIYTATGYPFTGWNTAADGSGTVLTGSTVVTADITVYAQWTATVTYTLTYAAGTGGTISGTSPQTVNRGASGAAVTAIPDSGYHFTRWSDGVLTAARTDTGITANLTVTASFQPDMMTVIFTSTRSTSYPGISVPYGNTAPLPANPTAAGWIFTGWNTVADGSGTAFTSSTIVTADITVYAQWTAAPVTYILTYAAGTNGTISGTTPQRVAKGSDATPITAIPNLHYHFARWSDGVLTATRTDTNITANLTSVTAFFEGDMMTVTYIDGLHETSTPQEIPYGETAGIPPDPTALDYDFTGWNTAADGSGTAFTGSPLVTADITVYAQWTTATVYTLNYLAGTGGTISGRTPQTMRPFASGTAVTAIPNPGYHFVSWSDGVTTAVRTDAGVTANKSVTANFAVDAPTTRTLAYAAGSGGAVSGTLLQTVALGGSGSSVTALPNTGYHFVSWSDGVMTATRTDSNVTADKSVTANFALNAIETRTLTYVAGTGGTVSGTSVQTVAVGGSGTAVTAVPNSGYHFVNWSDGSTQNPRTDTSVTTDKSVTANFAPDAIGTRTLSYLAGSGGTIAGITPQTVSLGGDGTTVTAIAASGYHFVSWSDGVTTAVRKDTNVTANLSVTASFASTQVATKLTMNVSPTRLSLGHSAHFFGIIAPNMPDRTPIRLMVRKAGQTKWTNLAPYVRTYSGYRWSFYYHPNTRGTYYFKVQFAGTAQFLGTTSRTVTVVWK